MHHVVAVSRSGLEDRNRASLRGFPVFTAPAPYSRLKGMLRLDHNPRPHTRPRDEVRHLARGVRNVVWDSAERVLFEAVVADLVQQSPVAQVQET